MVEAWVLWLFLVGVVIGIVITLVVVVRLPRGEGDVSDQERPTEAAFISAVIERHGGIAPVLLVEEVLELHQAYLHEARPPVPPRDAPGAPALQPPDGLDAWTARGAWPGPPSYPALPSPPPQGPPSYPALPAPAGYPVAPPGPPPASKAATPPTPR
jgi:hypothetical protein